MLDGPCVANGVCTGTLECDEAFVCVQPEAFRDPNTMPDAPVDAVDASVETIESSMKPDASVHVEASTEPDVATGQKDSSAQRPLAALGEDCDSTSGCEGDLSCERGTCKNLWDHPSCDPAATDRPECDQDDDCDKGLLCHVDGTCIEPGLCDAYGEATLATVGRGEPFALTASHIYLVYQESKDVAENPLHDAALTRIPVDGGAEETIASDLGPIDLFHFLGSSQAYQARVSGNKLYFSDTEYQLWQVEVSGKADPIVVTENAISTWAVDRNHIYYATRDNVFHRIDRTSNDDREIGSIDDKNTDAVKKIEIDSDALFFLINGEILAIWTIPKAGGSATEFLPHPQYEYISFTLSPDMLFFAASPPDFRIIAIDKTGGATQNLYHPDGEVDISDFIYYRDDLFWSTWSTWGNDIATGIHRTPTTPQESECIAELDKQTSFAIGDRGLFYNRNNHLIRQVLPEYDDVETSQGEEGGPCFDDDKCNNDLVCGDFYCVVDTCRDGTCDANENPCDCPEDCPVGDGATGALCCYDNDCSQPPNACLEVTCLDYECGEPLTIDNCCGNAICETGETAENCASDCSSE